MKVKNVIRTLCLLTFMLTFLPLTSLGYEVECKPGTIMWTNITASEAYNVCHQMSSGTSSIGSGALNPHMSTPQDYDAVSVLAISNYGNNATTSFGDYNGYYSTTSNASGVMNFGKYKAQNGITPEYTFTSGMMAHASNDSRRQSIIDAIKSGATDAVSIYDGDQVYNYNPTTDASIKTQMLSFRNNEANKGLGIMLADANNPNETGGLTDWTNSYMPNGYWGYADDRGYFYYNAVAPVLVKRHLFGFSVGYGNGPTRRRAVRPCIQHLDQCFGMGNLNSRAEQ